MAACGFLATDSPENQTDAVFVCMPSANPGGVKVSDFSVSLADVAFLELLPQRGPV